MITFAYSILKLMWLSSVLRPMRNEARASGQVEYGVLAAVDRRYAGHVQAMFRSLGICVMERAHGLTSNEIYAPVRLASFCHTIVLHDSLNRHYHAAIFGPRDCNNVSASDALESSELLFKPHGKNGEFLVPW